MFRLWRHPSNVKSGLSCFTCNKTFSKRDQIENPYKTVKHQLECRKLLEEESRDDHSTYTDSNPIENSPQSSIETDLVFWVVFPPSHLVQEIWLYISFHSPIGHSSHVSSSVRKVPGGQTGKEELCLSLCQTKTLLINEHTKKNLLIPAFWPEFLVVPIVCIRYSPQRSTDAVPLFSVVLPIVQLIQAVSSIWFATFHVPIGHESHTAVIPDSYSLDL